MFSIFFSLLSVSRVCRTWYSNHPHFTLTNTHTIAVLHISVCSQVVCEYVQKKNCTFKKQCLWHFSVYFETQVMWKESNLVSTVFIALLIITNPLCGLVVRLPRCRPGGPGFDSLHCQIFWVAVGLERGPLSLVRINEELLERKVAPPV
jgi:hypothetical protein